MNDKDTEASALLGFRGLDGSALQLYTIPETCELLRVSRWQVYQLINSQQLVSVKINRRRLVPAEELHAFVRRLRADQEAAA